MSATTTPTDPGATAHADAPDQTPAGPMPAPPADTLRMSGELASRLLASSRWLR